MDKPPRCAEQTMDGACGACSLSEIVQQLDRQEGEASANHCLRKTPHEFGIAAEPESEQRGNDGRHDDKMCERADDKVLYNVERVVPRQDGLTCGPTVPGREESCGCTSDGREKRWARM